MILQCNLKKEDSEETAGDSEETGDGSLSPDSGDGEPSPVSPVPVSSRTVASPPVPCLFPPKV